MEVQITQISPEFWEQYKELTREAIHNEPLAFHNNFGSTLDLHDDKWIKHLNNPSTSKTSKIAIVLVAIIRGQIVGIIAGFVGDEPDKEHIAHFASAYVKPKYRGKGIADKLIEELFAQIKNQADIIKVELEVVSKLGPALKFFEKHGFSQAGLLKRSIKIHNQYYDTILMEKFL